MRRVFASYAILQTYDEVLKKDYVANFVPFVVEAIRVERPERILLSDLQKQINEIHGFKIPQHPLHLILNRAKKSGYLRVHDRTFLPVWERVDQLEFGRTEARCLREYAALVERLRSFAVQHFRTELSADDAERLLDSYVTHYDVEILACSADGKSRPPDRASSGKAWYLTNRFVNHLHQNDPEGFGYLETAVKGHMLANALFLPSVFNPRAKIHGTHVFFDTPFLLKALGYEGQAAREPCKELLDLLRGAGARLETFEHTAVQVRDVLRACANRLGSTMDSEGYGAVFHYFQRTGHTRTTVEVEMHRLAQRIKDAGIEKVPAPIGDSTPTVDREALAEHLQADVHYLEEGSKLHDVDCLSFACRLRAGKQNSDLEECGAVFATTNAALCASTKTFFVSQKLVAESAFPLAATDYYLTTLLWLKHPNKAPLLPRKRLVAQCYAAMEPSERLWRKCIATMNALKEEGRINEDDYRVFCALPAIRSELMDITMGDEAQVTAETVEELLERAKQRLVEEERQKTEDAERRAQASEERLIALSQSVLEERRAQEMKLEGLGRRIGRVVGGIPIALLFVVMGVGTAFSLASPFGISLPAPLRWPGAACLAILAFLSIRSLWTGARLRSFYEREALSWALWIEGTLKRWLLPPE